jgi:hypothetical protein
VRREIAAGFFDLFACKRGGELVPFRRGTAPELPTRGYKKEPSLRPIPV